MRQRPTKKLLRELRHKYCKRNHSLSNMTLSQLRVELHSLLPLSGEPYSAYWNYTAQQLMGLLLRNFVCDELDKFID